jgi:GNAT superfamily N-acetyltransferase
MIFHSHKLGPGDIPLIQQVGRATYEPYYPHIWLPGGLDWYMERCFSAESLTPELADPNVEYHAPRDENGAIIGLLKLLLDKPTPDRTVQNALYLEKIYLMPDFYGQGWGQQLMQYVFEKAATLGREAVWLVCMENGPLWAYERAGFVKTGTVHWDFELLKDAERTGFVMLRNLA